MQGASPRGFDADGHAELLAPSREVVVLAQGAVPTVVAAVMVSVHGAEGSVRAMGNEHFVEDLVRERPEVDFVPVMPLVHVVETSLVADLHLIDH